MEMRELLRECKTLVGPFPEFHPQDTPKYPVDLFIEWLQNAIQNGVPEPHAMILATADCNGYPDSRVLILKDIDQDGWYFASSSLSVKGMQIQGNPRVALTFYWPSIGRQIRIRGVAEKMSEEQSAQDFLDRGTIARAVALIGKQSTILESLLTFDEAVMEQIANIEEKPDQVYELWTLYRVAATEVEVWQADRERKHIRLKYRLKKEKWTKNLLWA